MNFLSLIPKDVSFYKFIINKLFPTKLNISFQNFINMKTIDFRIYRDASNTEYVLPYFNYKLIEGKIVNKIDNCKISIDVENNNYVIVDNFQIISNHNLEFLPIMIHYNIIGYNREPDGLLVLETKIVKVVLRLGIYNEVVLNENNNFILYVINNEVKYKYNLKILVNYKIDFPKHNGFIITPEEPMYNPFKYFPELRTEIVNFEIADLKTK